MIALLKYNYKIYMKYNKFMIPLIFYLLFQLIYYSTGSEKFVPSIIVCASVVFCIMTWMGFNKYTCNISYLQHILYFCSNYDLY